MWIIVFSDGSFLMRCGYQSSGRCHDIDRAARFLTPAEASKIAQSLDLQDFQIMKISDR